MTFIGAGCRFAHRGDTIRAFDPGGRVLLDVKFMSLAAARGLNQELAQLIRNLEEDHGTEDMRRLLANESQEA